MAKTKYLNKLPPYLHSDCCEEIHFLTLSMCIDGSWCIGYVEMEGGHAISGLGLNDSDTIEEAATRMYYALERYYKRNKELC